MNPNHEEKRLKALCLELRHAEERRAPSFDGTWQAAAARAREAGRPAYAVRIVAAATVLAALAAMSIVWRARMPSPLPVSPAMRVAAQPEALPWRSTVLVSEWHSPTDFLLQPVARSDERGKDSQAIPPDAKNKPS